MRYLCMDTQPRGPMRIFLLIGAVILFVLVAILCFIGGVAITHLLAFLSIGFAAFAASFLPIP